MSHLDDERVARLQRAAYGAHVPDAERAAAEAKLAALRHRMEVDPVGHEHAHAHATNAADPRVVRAEPPADPSPPAPPAHERLIAACAVALLAGVAIGWSLDALAGQVESTRSVLATETEAWRVFDLPALNGHPSRYPDPAVDLDLDPESRRVLASRWDGVRLIAVRTFDGRDACLILVVPLGPPATACTTDGRFPLDGLMAVTEMRGDGVYSATWDATGRVSLAPARPAE